MSIISVSKLLRYVTTIAALLLTSAAFAEEVEMIRLFGTPEQIGTAWGEMNKEAIIRDMDAKYSKRAAEAGISKETLIERGKKAVGIISQIAPHWHDEARAIARAADLDEDLFLAYCWSISRGRFLHTSKEDAAGGDQGKSETIVECTSYAVPRDRISGSQLLFHKTRDNVDRPQVAVMMESSLDGINKFIAVTDVSHINGHSVMVNERGLAGAADYPAHLKKDSSTLKLPSADAKFRGLMSGEMLRYIAERASTAAEALAIVEDFVAKAYYAGGKVNGTHWLFVDRNGTILEICSNCGHVVSKYHTEGTYFSRFNKSEPAVRMREADKVNFQMFQSVFRERPILTGQSIAGLTVEIDPDYPELLTVAWIALPARTAAFPVFMGQRRTPSGLLDGTAYASGKRTPARGEEWAKQKARCASLEAAMHEDKQGLLADVKESVAAGNPLEGDIARLESWSQDQAAMLMGELEKTD